MAQWSTDANGKVVWNPGGSTATVVPTGTGTTSSRMFGGSSSRAGTTASTGTTSTGTTTTQPAQTASQISTGILSGYGATPTTKPYDLTPATAPTSTTSNADYVSSLYAGLGRTGDTEGMAYWTKQLDSGVSRDQLTKTFQDSANYVLGDARLTNMQKEALAPNYYNWGETKPETPASASASTPAGTEYKPNLNQEVDFNTMTIEGRINNLMNSPVVRQAGERAMAAFAGRGLLNSSMAIEAANEAMIAKAIEIAGPDAETYFKQSNINQDWTNKFAQNYQNQEYNLQNAAVAQQYAKELKTLDQAFQSQNVDRQYANQLQTNYLQSMMNFEDQYNKAVMAIQGSEMNQEDKAAAIKAMQIQKENNILFTTEAFSMMPQWKNDWSALTGGVGALQEAPEGVDVAAGPANATRAQIYKAIQYAAEDPSYMTDEQFAVWAQAAVQKGLISEKAYQELIGK